LAPGTGVVLQDRGGAARQTLEACRPHRRQWLVKLSGVDSIDAARRWVGSRLCVDIAALEKLGPGEYYHYQVIGFEMFSRAGLRIGTISGTLTTAAGEIYVVQGAEREHLIPAVKEIIEKVDFTAERVIIDPPDGLLEL
jgi:16S rRNA processing protein RimM